MSQAGMRRRLASLLLALAMPVLRPAAALGQSAHALADGKVAEGTLSFDGHASAGDFVGKTSTVTGEMKGAETLEGVRGWVEASVGTLKTGNDRRDRDMNKSMETDKYPTMRFDLDGVSPGGTGDSLPATLKGRLTIHGVERPAELPATVVIAPGVIHVRGEFPLNLKDYKIGGLTKLFGALRMYEDIKVHVDLTFHPTQ